MPLTRLRKKFTPKRPVAKSGDPPRPWPVDPELARRADETRKRIAHARRQIALHVLPTRRRDRGSGDEARSAARAGRR
jgi:hypothetical protein